MTPEQTAVAAQCNFLQGLTPDELAAFLAAGRRQEAAAGAFLIHQADPATHFYIVLSGQVRLSQLTPEGHQITIHYAAPGEAIGIIVALSHSTYPVSAEVITDATLWVWDEAAMEAQLLAIPRLALNGMAIIARRFTTLQDSFRELATERVERRVARALLRLVRQLGRKTETGILIDLPLSRQDLADMTGTTPFTTSRILSQWEKAGWIESKREQIVLLQPHKLVIIAEDLPER